MAYTTSEIQSLITAAAARHGVDPALALAVARQESNFNPDATSGAGAQGVMQLMPATAASLGVSDSYNPEQNIDAGVRYIGMMFNRFGSPDQALAAYNFGPGNVSRGREWPTETRNYVDRVLGFRQQYAGEFQAPYFPAPGEPPPQGPSEAGAVSGIGSTITLFLLAIAGGLALLFSRK